MTTSDISKRVLPLHMYVLSSLFAGLTAIGAFLRIPLPYVPFTLQDFFVLLSGSVLGPYFGFFSQMLYLTVGLLGLPVFANGGGPAYIFQPTFGYLLAFPLCAFLVGSLVHGKGEPPTQAMPFWTLFGRTLAGYMVIYVLGISVLYLNLKYLVAQPRALAEVVWIGGVIFLPGTLVKAAASAFLTRRLLRVMRLPHPHRPNTL